MGYLVYYPTCNGKMSNNAECCPHCGETRFYTKKEYYSKKVPCDVCCGSGELISTDSVQIRCEGDEIIGIEAARILDWKTEMDGNGEIWDIPIKGEQHANISEIKSCIKNKQYKIKHNDPRKSGVPVIAISATADYGRIGKCKGYSNATLIYHKTRHKCYNCNGIGYFIDNSAYRLRDVRKRVEMPTSKNRDDEFDRLLDEYLKNNL